MGRRISTGGRGRDRGERVKERRQELAWGFTSSIEMGQVGKSRGPSGSGAWWFPWDPAPPGASHGIDERLCHLFWGGGGGFSWKAVGNKEAYFPPGEKDTKSRLDVQSLEEKISCEKPNNSSPISEDPQAEAALGRGTSMVRLFLPSSHACLPHGRTRKVSNLTRYQKTGGVRSH